LNRYKFHWLSRSLRNSPQEPVTYVPCNGNWFGLANSCLDLESGLEPGLCSVTYMYFPYTHLFTSSWSCRWAGLELTGHRYPSMSQVDARVPFLLLGLLLGLLLACRRSVFFFLTFLERLLLLPLSEELSDAGPRFFPFLLVLLTCRLSVVRLPFSNGLLSLF